MSKKARLTRRKRIAAPVVVDAGAVFVRLVKDRLTNRHDPRSHAEFLRDMKAGELANPATAALLDRLERAIK